MRIFAIILKGKELIDTLELFKGLMKFKAFKMQGSALGED